MSWPTPLGNEHRDADHDRRVHRAEREGPRADPPSYNTRLVATETNLSPRPKVNAPGHPGPSLKKEIAIAPAGTATQRDHLARQFSLEPALVIAVNSQVDAQKAGDRRSRDPQGRRVGALFFSMCVGIVRT